MTNEQLEALYGPAARFSDHKKGDTICYRSGNLTKQGEILWVCASGPVIQGGPDHPVRYIVDNNEGMPDVVYPVDVIGK